jgi:hypothetical protein
MPENKLRLSILFVALSSPLATAKPRLRPDLKEVRRRIRKIR